MSRSAGEIYLAGGIHTIGVICKSRSGLYWRWYGVLSASFSAEELRSCPLVGSREMEELFNYYYQLQEVDSIIVERIFGLFRTRERIELRKYFNSIPERSQASRTIPRTITFARSLRRNPPLEFPPHPFPPLPLPVFYSVRWLALFWHSLCPSSLSVVRALMRVDGWKIPPRTRGSARKNSWKERCDARSN